MEHNWTHIMLHSKLSDVLPPHHHHREKGHAHHKSSPSRNQPSKLHPPVQIDELLLLLLLLQIIDVGNVVLIINVGPLKHGSAQRTRRIASSTSPMPAMNATFVKGVRARGQVNEMFLQRYQTNSAFVSVPKTAIALLGGIFFAFFP